MFNTKFTCILTLMALAGTAIAQPSTGEYVWWSYSYASGSHTNSTSMRQVMDVHQVNIPGATSLRLKFDNVVLGPEDCIQIISNWDGNTQEQYPSELQKWSNTSAYFNGESVTVKLWVNPGSTASFAIRDLIAGAQGSLGFHNTICGPTDDRVLSTDWRAMRAVSSPTGSGGGCTIWAASPTNHLLSAGHCTGTFGVAEAEVPLSTGGGGAQHPPSNRQWPITNLGGTGSGIGNDYAVTTVATNAQGQWPSQLYGHFTLGFFIPQVNDPIRITGYGSTSSPVSPTWNVVNKTHAGVYVTTGGGGTGLGYNADTTGGNSGSPVICDISGLAVGIHTHGGCSSTGGNNWGTSLTLPAFQSLWASSGGPTPPSGVCATPVAPTASFTSSNPNVLQGSAISFTDTSTGGVSNWAWDLNGDGITDSTQANPSYIYNTPGSYTVSLTVSNAQGTDTVTMPNYVTVSTLTAATLPVSEDFNAGLPSQGASGWVFSSTNSFGAIAAGQSGPVSPNSGGNALTLASNTDGNYVENDAILVIDLAAAGGATLTYWIKETSDEDHPQDGLWISDGANEALVQAHTGTFISGTWTQYTIDLDQAAAANGVAITSTFRVIWRQYDNFTLGTDGHLVDDIDIQPDNQFSLTLTSSGGDLLCDLQNVPAGTAQGFTLFSFNTSLPVGMGNIYGINADTQTFVSLMSPAAPGNLFHWVLPAPSFAFPNSPFVLPPGTLNAFIGMTADGQGLALTSSFGLLGTTNVVRTTLNP